MMYVYTYLHFFFSKEVIFMVKNIAKSMLFMGIGIGATIMYQKYSKPVMKEMEKIANKAMKKIDKELEEMM